MEILRRLHVEYDKFKAPRPQKRHLLISLIIVMTGGAAYLPSGPGFDSRHIQDFFQKDFSLFLRDVAELIDSKDSAIKLNS